MSRHRRDVLHHLPEIDTRVLLKNKVLFPIEHYDWPCFQKYIIQSLLLHIWIFRLCVMWFFFFMTKGMKTDEADPLLFLAEKHKSCSGRGNCSNSWERIRGANESKGSSKVLSSQQEASEQGEPSKLQEVPVKELLLMELHEKRWGCTFPSNRICRRSKDKVGVPAEMFDRMTFSSWRRVRAQQRAQRQRGWDVPGRSPECPEPLREPPASSSLTHWFTSFFKVWKWKSHHPDFHLKSTKPLLSSPSFQNYLQIKYLHIFILLNKATINDVIWSESPVIQKNPKTFDRLRINQGNILMFMYIFSYSCSNINV